MTEVRKDVRRRIEVSGIVQGVGFRPYVYRLATTRRLKGTIRNTSAGVTIEIQGPVETVQDFIEHLPPDAPPLARIPGFTINELPCVTAQSVAAQGIDVQGVATQSRDARSGLDPDFHIIH